MIAYLTQLGALLAILLGGLESHHRRARVGPWPFALVFGVSALLMVGSEAISESVNPFLPASLSLAILAWIGHHTKGAMAGAAGIALGIAGLGVLGVLTGSVAAGAVIGPLAGALVTLAAYAALTHLDLLRSPPVQAGVAVASGGVVYRILVDGLASGGVAPSALALALLMGAVAGGLTGAYLSQELDDFRGEGALGLTPLGLWVPAERLRSPFARVFWEAPQAFLVTDAGSDAILDANRQACELLGRERTELVGLHLPALFEGELDHHGRPAKARLIRPGDASGDNGAEGEPVRVEVRISSIRLGRRALELVAVSDITRRANEQEQLIRAERLDVVARFSSGVAHDFNNLLQGILGYAEHLSPRSEPRALKRGLSTIQRYAERGAELSQAMQDLSLDREKIRGTADAREAAENVQQVVARAFPVNIRLEVRTGDEPLYVPLPVRRLEELILAVANNARDVMPDGGELTLEVRPSIIQIPTGGTWMGLGPGAYVEIAVRDTGPGFPEGMERIAFEPYSSTKEGAAGMGLAVVYSLVNAAGGGVEIDSSPRGTEVRMWLPQVECPPQTVGRAARHGPAPSTRRILVVDDEADLREMIETLLLAGGYEVTQAEDGAVALDILADDQGFDTILLDMVMPNVDGAGVIRELKRRECEIPIVLATGYAPEELDPEVHPMISSTLRKPFLAKDLYDALEDARRPEA